MKTAFQIPLSFVSFIATYFFIFWTSFPLIAGALENRWVATALSLLLAVVASVFDWKKTSNFSNGLASSILMGRLVVGSISYVLGFFGPIIFDPSGGQGPILGLLITGPLGFIAGLAGGAISWIIKQRKKRLLLKK